MNQPRILVAGIGNIFFGDDAFGVEVVRRLARRAWPDNVRVVDFGIRGLDLAYALMDGWDRAIFIDATRRGGPPGTLYVIEPELTDADGWETAANAHGLDPGRVLRLVTNLGGTLPPLTLVGCEPGELGSDEAPALDLSPPVRAAVEEAVRLVESMIVPAETDEEEHHELADNL